VSVRLVEHVILRSVGGLRFPFCVVRNLSVSCECAIVILLIRIEDAAASIVDVRLGRRHPVSGEVGLSIRSSDYRSSWSRGSPTPSAASATGRALSGRSAALRGSLANQYVGEHENQRKTEDDR
jgi:hypothetical protein